MLEGRRKLRSLVADHDHLRLIEHGRNILDQECRQVRDTFLDEPLVRAHEHMTIIKKATAFFAKENA